MNRIPQHWAKFCILLCNCSFYKEALIDLTYERFQFQKKIISSFYLNIPSSLCKSLALPLNVRLGCKCSSVWERGQCYKLFCPWFTNFRNKPVFVTVRLEKLAGDHHSSPLRKVVNCRQNKFYNIGPRASTIRKFY